MSAVEVAEYCMEDPTEEENIAMALFLFGRLCDEVSPYDVQQSGPEPLDEIGCADLALREIKLTEEQAVAIVRITQDKQSGPRCAPKLCEPWPLDDVGE